MTNFKPFFGDLTATKQRRSGFTLIETIVVLFILMVLLALMMPAVSRSRYAARPVQCRHNLKQIELALSQYQYDHGVYPPAFTTDETGRRLHSWRTVILPYLDQNQLYQSVDLTKAWDDDSNKLLEEAFLATYRCPAANIRRAQTTYLAVVTPQSVIRAPQSLSKSEIKDGPSKTMVVMEVPDTQAVPWMSPSDADEETVLSIKRSTRTAHQQGMTILMADGTVRFLPSDLAAEVRKAMITAAGNDTVKDF